MSAPREKRIAYWYFGGLASAGAACFTHPLDLLKVTLQTQQDNKMSLVSVTGKVIRERGVTALYNGISASLLRQLTYSTARFAIYEVGRKSLPSDAGFMSKVLLAGAAGAAGGLIGSPADLVNVRMQNDVKLPAEQRRNYKHAIDGLMRVRREEGFLRLFSGVEAAASRGFVMTVGQVAFYEQIKSMLLQTGYFKDDPRLHFVASLMAGGMATLLTQPLDVVKTRLMNGAPGEFKGILDVVRVTAQLGPQGFFKGFVPAFARLGPHTILTFLLLEQLRLNLGYLPTEN